MYIQEIIVDGFKSYAQKTVIAGWDPQFNAITGLNGTGKSNILDSICFVLGISALAQVRVGNLQELVYKQGQAGVTKASVTIIFNNADPAGSPVGYESNKEITVTRQVVIGGKNKYMINGHTVQQSLVQNMFHSVQLNVNNPHFLIMQGRITKVLNMKPEETLSMIEEAAGTRMFEDKKQAALKTISKKQLKLDEISKCMDEEITPTLDSLRAERQDYHTWQANNNELERLDRFCVAFDYKTAEEKVSSAEEKKQELFDEFIRNEDIKKENELAANERTQTIKEIQNLRDADSEGGLSNLKQKEDAISKNLVKANTLYENHEESLTREKENIVASNTQIVEAEEAVAVKKGEIETCGQELKAKETELISAEEAHSSMREKYQNAIAGVADSSNADLLSFPEQIAAWEKKERETTSQIQQYQLKSDHTNKSLKELRKSTKGMSQSHSSGMQEATNLKQAIAGTEKKLKAITVSEKQEGTLRSTVDELRKATTVLRDQTETLSASLEARLNFEFKDPERGFDRSKVKGLVAKLVRVKDSKATTALEIAAGAKLYQVVVDTAETGKQILQKGELRKRVTILPLNKISNKCVDGDRLNKAKDIATAMGGTACLALELVGYDEDVKKAMEHVFGSTIICDTPDIAKKITFEKTIRNRTVTLDGDTYEPSGTLSGGAKNNLGVLLGKIEELAVAQDQLKSKEGELREATKVLAAAEQELQQARDLTTDLENKNYALQLCESKIADSTYAVGMADISRLESDLSKYDEEIKSLKVQHEEAKEELKKLSTAEKDTKKQREKAMKDMEAQVKVKQKTVATVKSEVQKLKNKHSTLLAEIKDCENDIVTAEASRKAAESTLKDMTKESKSLSEKVRVLAEQLREAEDATAVMIAELDERSKEIKSLQKQKENLLKEANSAGLEMKKLEAKLKQFEKDVKLAQGATANLIKSNPWIATEKEYFGQEGSDFDFNSKDVNVSIKRLETLRAADEKLRKKINKKVMGMIENAESEYAELSRKKDVVLNDKRKIEKVIEELDVKKTQALQTTWIKVNRDFGSIFAMLLPGCSAKLEPPEGCSVCDGLEVKVAFNGVWKESLTELSGGQRSLLALSLILSLLLFKPAPMYILDEVDAALDLSHTQNIGMMLRTHFKNSQFIVVSLKEGMFNNANVIYRTKFVDGISTVVRTVAGGMRGGMNANARALADSSSSSNANVGKGAKNTTTEQDPDLFSPEKKRGKGTKGAAKGRKADQTHLVI